VTRLTDAQKQDLRARTDMASLARELGADLRRSGGKMIGSCPMCGGGKRATRFAIDRERWVCAVCCDGGDCFALVMKATGCDFRSAVERLGGARALDAEETRRMELRRQLDENMRALRAKAHRLREIHVAKRLWRRAGYRDFRIVERYLAARGCAIPNSAPLRGERNAIFYHGDDIGEGGVSSPRIVFRGPAMLAAIVDNDGAFCGLHTTFLNADASGKASIVDPETGEELSAKKLRGVKEGGHIALRSCAAPRRLFMGEGIETVLSVATALRDADRLRRGDAFWSAVDLSNLGGPAAASIAHPTLTTPAGRPRRLPGPQPDVDGPAIRIPDSVEELVLLGDGDSERVLTETALERARRRYAREGRVIRCAFAPQGRDFNDLLREGGG
jgi:hypothetical protein